MIIALSLEFALACSRAQGRGDDGFKNYAGASFTARYEFNAEDTNHRLHGTLTWYRVGEHKNRIDLDLDASTDTSRRQLIAIDTDERSVLCDRRYRDGVLDESGNCFDVGDLVKTFRSPSEIVLAISRAGRPSNRTVSGRVATCRHTEPPADDCFSDDGIPMYSTGVSFDAVALMAMIEVAPSGVSHTSNWLGRASGALAAETAGVEVDEHAFEVPFRVAPFPGFSPQATNTCAHGCDP